MDDHPATPGQILYQPGCEPEDIRQKIQRLKDKLDSAYPDKVVTRLHIDHKKWGEAVTKLYRQLGYPDGKAFLAAYGYTMQNDKTGRPAEDHMAVISELKKRYAHGPTCTSTTQLLQQNPELAPKLKSLSNQATKLFGMSLAKYLKMEGILVNSTARERHIAEAEANRQQALETAPGELEKLRQRYQDAPYDGEAPIAQFWVKNFDIDRNALRLYAEEQGLMVQTLLQREGIIESQQQVQERKERELSNVIAILQSRYPAGTVLPGNVAQLRRENNDLDLSWLEIRIRNLYRKTAKEYLLSRGLLMDMDSGALSERMEKMSAVLQKQYASASVRPFTIQEVRRDNPELSFKDFFTWTRDYKGKSSIEYLVELGVLDMDPDKLWEYECFRHWTRTSTDNFNYPDQLPCAGRRFFVTGQHASQEEREQMTRRLQFLGGRVERAALVALDCIVGVHPGTQLWARRLELGKHQLWVMNSAMADSLLNKEGGRDNG